MMEGLLLDTARYASMAIQAIAILIVIIGVIEALSDIVRLLLSGHASDAARCSVWLTFARWLVAGLTFQLAADIVATTIAPTWDEVGRLAAIAAIRTFLTFFLDRDIEAMRARLHDSPPEKSDARRA